METAPKPMPKNEVEGPKPTFLKDPWENDPTYKSRIVPPWLTELLPHMHPKKAKFIIGLVEDWRKVTGK